MHISGYKSLWSVTERRWSVPLAYISNCCEGAVSDSVSWGSLQSVVVHVLCVCAPGAHPMQFGCKCVCEPCFCSRWLLGVRGCLPCRVWSPEFTQLGPRISWLSKFSSLVISLLEECAACRMTFAYPCLKYLQEWLHWPKQCESPQQSAGVLFNGNAQVSQAVLSEP